MITVALVNAYNYLGRGEEYVSKMVSMVDRHLKQPHQFKVLGDCGLPSYWNKIALFKPGQFTGKVLYLDLDAVVTGSLDELVETEGIIYLTDWGWKHHSYGSGVMIWEAGEHEEVWTQFSKHLMNFMHGDQDHLTALGGWDALPAPPVLCSYRYHCKRGVPVGCAVVSFHGSPKMSDLPSNHWVHEYWR